MNYERAVQVRNLARSGWMVRGVPPSMAETVAAHTFEVALLTLIITDRLLKAGASIDKGKALTMAVIHDIPESVSGDIIKWVKDRIECADKIDEESLKAVGLDEYVGLIKEFNRCESLEALIVKIADNLATHLQARRYLSMGFKGVKDILEGCLIRINELLNKKPLLRYREAIAELMESITQQSQ